MSFTDNNTLGELVDETTLIKDDVTSIRNKLKSQLDELGVDATNIVRINDLVNLINTIERGYKQIPGATNIFYSDSSEQRTGTSNADVFKKFFTMDFLKRDFPLRLMFDLRENEPYHKYPTESKIEVVNSGNVIFERIIPALGTTYVTFGEDFDIKKGDTLNLYMRQVINGGIGYIKNIKVSFDLIDLKTGEAIEA